MTQAAKEKCRAYVDALIQYFVDLPGTPRRASRQDRRLASQLHLRGIPLPAITAALCLAAARRELRSKKLSPLAPIRTLHYFLPVLEEIQELPLDPAYVGYLQNKLRPFLKSTAPLYTTSGQKSAVPDGR